MPNEGQETSPAIGDNSNRAPLAEILAEEAKPLRDRAEALIASVNAALIDSPETAAAVTTLGGMLSDLRARAETARKEHAKPFDDGKTAVQQAFARDVIQPIDLGIAACCKMVDAWRAALDAEAAAERRKRDAEAAAARRAAEDAERAKAAAEAAGDTGAAISAEIKQMQAEERATRLESDAGTIRPHEAIRTQAGMASTTTTRVPTVTDLQKCLRYLAKNQSVALIEAITPIIGRLTRAKVDIPGVEVHEVGSTRFRR